MGYLTTLAFTALTLIGHLVQASSIGARQAPDRFYLVTQVVPGTNDCGSNKQGLYVFSYHTGAGLGIAAAKASAPSSWFYLNETELLWTYENNETGPWPVVLQYGPYQAFNPISISIAVGPPTPGFIVNATGLQSNQSSNGWLACDWWYQSPQIFSWNNPASAPLPTSCSRVNLIPVAAAPLPITSYINQ